VIVRRGLFFLSYLLKKNNFKEHKRGGIRGGYVALLISSYVATTFVSSYVATFL